MRICILARRGRTKARSAPAPDITLHGTTFGVPYLPQLSDLPVVAPQLLIAAPGYEKNQSAKMALEYMARGFSLGGVAGALGVSRRTISDWMLKHEEFKQACERGTAFRQRYWEGRLIEVAETGGNGSQGQVAIFGVLNAGREDWSNRSQIEHSGNLSFSSIVEQMIAALDQKRAEKEARKLAAPDNGGPIIEHVQSPSDDSSDCF
jgi:hypothetical protein